MSSSPIGYQSVIDYIKDTTKRYITKGAYYLVDSVFENGAIYNAKIDMNNKRIHNVGTPIANGDAVPYGLFASVTSEFEPFELIGTNITTYANSPSYGTYFVNVRCQTDGGPTGCWCFSRASAADMKYTKILICSASADDDNNKTTLDVNWPSNSPLMITKSSSLFDGTYEIKVSR